MPTTPRQVIEKRSPNQFLLYWLDGDDRQIPNSKIILDFNPLLKAIGHSENIAIVHYQARPAFFRRFGVFHRGEYYPVEEVRSSIPYETVSLHETNLICPPNAVIVHRDCSVTIKGGTAIISPAIA